MATGRPTIERLLQRLVELGLTIEHVQALDFGCGVGRLSQPLAEHFRQVDGVDISDSMIQFARRVNKHGDRVRYHRNATPDLRLFASETFDLVFSNITLQHMPPQISMAYMAEFVRIAKPNGVVVFQIPSHIKSPRARLRKELENRAPGLLSWYRMARRRPEPPGNPYSMYGVGRRRVERHIRGSGGTVVTRDRDLLAPPWVSYRYYVVPSSAAR